MRLPIFALAALFLLAAGIDLTLWFELRSLKRRWPRVVFAVITSLCYILLVATACWPKRSADGDILPIMWCLYIWLSVYAAKLVWMIFSLLGLIPIVFRRERIPLGLYIGLPLGLIVLAYMWWGATVTRRQIEVKSVEVISARLPEAFDGFRIVQISDLHLGTWGNDTTFVSALVDSVNTLRPDIIVFTGDLVNRRASEALPFEPVLSRLSAPAGVYSILGNHDYGDYISWKTPQEKDANLKSLKELQKRANMKLLDNEHIFLHRESDSISLIGVGNWGEPPFHVYGDLRRAYSTDSVHSLTDSVYKILLSHNPVHWDEEVVKISNIDLMLAGHTHAMQFVVKLGRWVWSPSVWKYARWGGLYSGASVAGSPSSLYVNIGAGEVGMPARIGASEPEITVITLKR